MKDKMVIIIKKFICNLLGHKWQYKYHRHNRYYGLTCSRCGIKAEKR